MAPQASAQDRRRFARTLVQLHAAVAPPGEASRQAVIHDLSLGGAFVRTSTLRPIGTPLVVRLPLPDACGGVQWVEGRVVRIVDSMSEGGIVVTGMGVEFKLSSEQRDGLSQLIDGIVAVKVEGKALRSTLPPGTRFVGEDEPQGGDPGVRPRMVLMARCDAPPGAAPPRASPLPTPQHVVPAVPPPLAVVPREADVVRRSSSPPVRLSTIPPARRAETAPEPPPSAASLAAPSVLPAGLEETSLRLDLLRRGQVRSVRVPLTELRDAGAVRSYALLDVRVYCRAPGRSFQLEVRGDFGGNPPRSALLRIFLDARELGEPAVLVSRGVPSEPELGLETGTEAERLVFRVTAEPDSGAPRQFAGVVRLKESADPSGKRDSPTGRWRSARALVKAELGAALRQSSAPALVLLGRLMEHSDPGGKLELLRKLVEAQSDVRLLEAAAADIALCVQLDKGFPEVDFPALSLNDPAEASLVIFHPRSPTYLLAVCFVLCLENNLAPVHERDAVWWRELAKAGAVALWRRDRASLEELAGTMRAGSDPVKAMLLEKLTKWASRRSTSVPPEPRERLDDQLSRIRGRNQEAAVATALEALVDHGYLVVTGDSVVAAS
jgi:hypothetical protein